MEGIAADERRGARVISARELGRLAPVPCDELAGGLHASLDLRVDPRRAVAALAALLDDDPAARVIWDAPVHEIDPGLVRSAAGDVRAPLVVVCPGPDHDWLGPELSPHRDGLTRCKLQMLRVAAPAARVTAPPCSPRSASCATRATAISPAPTRCVPGSRPNGLSCSAAGVHLIVTQLPGGDLLLGDTHEYGDTVSPFSDERLDELVLAEARRLLGTDRLEVRQRWHGVYPSAPGHPFLIAEPLPGVAVVEIVSGRGDDDRAGARAAHP